MWGYGKKLVDAWQNSALKLQFWPRMIDSVERERERRKTLFSFICFLLTVGDIYIQG